MNESSEMCDGFATCMQLHTRQLQISMQHGHFSFELALPYLVTFMRQRAEDMHSSELSTMSNVN